jgi:hypothetical protein
VIDAQHFAIGFAFEPGRLIQRIGDRDQVSAVVVTVEGAFARTILKTFDLGQTVPPEVFGLLGRVDDGVGQAVVAVEVFGLVAETVSFRYGIGLVVAAGSLSSAVGLDHQTHQPGR